MEMNSILIILMLSISYPVFSSQNILGEFSTVTESACNSEIHLYKNGDGIFIDSCRKEDGSRIDNTKKTKITWHIKEENIIVKINGINELFTYHDNLSCVDFGGKGSANGLVGFDYHFWRRPITCK